MVKMTKYIATIYLIISFSILSIAEEISDFEIEGISIGDSLLNYYKKSEIENAIYTGAYKSDKFLMVTFLTPNDTYEALQFHVKKNDDKFKIYSISGQTKMSLKPCLKKRDKIIQELKGLFPKTKLLELDKREHPGYKNSYSYSSYFQFVSGDLIEIACYDYSPIVNKSAADKLTVSLDTKEFNDFLTTAF